MSTRIGWWIAALVMSVVSIGSGAMVATNAIAWHRVEQRDQVAADGVTELIVDAELLAVEVTTTLGTTIDVDSSLRSGLRSPRFEITRDGSRVGISFECSNAKFAVTFCSGVLRIAVPEGIDLTVTTELGDVTAYDLDARRVVAESDLGDVTLSWRSAPETVLIRTGGGRVRLALPVEQDGLSGYDVAIRTESGQVVNDLPVSTASQNRLDIGTETGDIELRPT